MHVGCFRNKAESYNFFFFLKQAKPIQWKLEYIYAATRVVSGACTQSLDVKAWVSLPGRQHALHSVTWLCWERQVLCRLHDCPEASWKPAPGHEDQRPSVPQLRPDVAK